MTDEQGFRGGYNWDEDFARNLLGRTLLVGITYLEQDGSIAERQQIFGTVQSCNAKTGIVITLKESGETFTVAPILEAIEPAKPGVYQMKDSDNVIINPDFTAMFSVTRPGHN